MLDRISVSVSLATILAVLGKLAFLFDSKNGSGLFANDNTFWHDITIILVAVFMILFRAKMMHDDHQYFKDIEMGRYSGANQGLNKFAIFLGYVSWLLWGPAICFLDKWPVFGIFMATSMSVSLIWAAIDSEQIPPSSPRYKRKEGKPDSWIVQHSWVMFNFGYIIAFLFFTSNHEHEMFKFWSAVGLLVIFIADWFISDPIAGIIEAKDQKNDNGGGSPS
jgi:hypothetical protein